MREYATFDQVQDNRIIAGTKTKVAKNTVAFSEYRLGNGTSEERAQKSYGLRNKFMLGKSITGNVTFDEDYGFMHKTSLLVSRLVYDIGDRFDIGAEMRVARGHESETVQKGGAVELETRVQKDLWVGVGWSFDSFNADLIGENYEGKGPFIKIRMKFDENIFGSKLKKTKKHNK